MRNDGYAWRSSDGDTTTFSEAVFPICHRCSDDRREGVATGFFVSRFGLFLTAAHVFQDFDLEHDMLFATHFIEVDHTHCQRRILRAYCHDSTDIAIGVAEPIYHRETHDPFLAGALALTEEIPRDEGEIFSFGYPSTTVIDHSEVTPALLEPFWTRGAVEQAFPMGRDRVMQPGHCIQTTLESYGGASGAPVMDSHGRTFGVISTGGLSERTTFVAPICDALDIKMPGVIFQGQPTYIPTLRDVVPHGGLAPPP